MYTSNTYSSYEGCDRFSFSGSAFTTKSAYISDYDGTPTGYDIAFQPAGGNIWMATDDATSPVSCYDHPSGGIMVSLPASIGIGSDCRGLAFETGSSQYLWVSNITVNELYRVDLGTGVGEDYSSDLESASVLTCSQNPFSGSVVLQGQGFGAEAVLEIFDAAGRLVLEEVFTGTLHWNATAEPTGSYFAIMRTTEGISDVLRLVKL
jgi:hypothetical protein